MRADLDVQRRRRAPGSAPPTRPRRGPRRPRAPSAAPRPGAWPATPPRRPCARRCAAGRACPRRAPAPRSARARAATASSGWGTSAGTGPRSNITWRDVDARDAVDERVVGLGDEREAAALEALDHPHLPQRLGAVELLGEDPPGQQQELLLGARVRQRGVAHVVLEAEARVVDPQRPAGAGRRHRELLAVARHEVQAPAQRVEHLGVRRRRALEDRARLQATGPAVQERRSRSAGPDAPGLQAGNGEASSSAARGRGSGRDVLAADQTMPSCQAGASRGEDARRPPGSASRATARAACRSSHAAGRELRGARRVVRGA